MASRHYTTKLLTQINRIINGRKLEELSQEEKDKVNEIYAKIFKK